MDKVAYKVGEKVFKDKQPADLYAIKHGGEIETVPLLEDQIVRKGRVITLTSATHHQRHSPCMILIQTDKHNRPFRFTCLPVNHSYEPRRDVLPFDCFLDLGAMPNSDSDRALMSQAFGLENFFDMFENWFEKCDLGVSAIQEPRKFLPMYIDLNQYELMKQLHISEFFTKPVRFIETIMAFSNDVDWVQNKDVRFGKNSYTQFATKCRNEMERDDRGPLRLDKLAKAYHYHLLTR